jgi:hypothetical protein
VEKAVAAMTSYGSTGPAEVRRQIAHWKEILSQETDHVQH